MAHKITCNSHFRVISPSGSKNFLRYNFFIDYFLIVQYVFFIKCMALTHMYMYGLDALNFAIEYLTLHRSYCPCN